MNDVRAVLMVLDMQVDFFDRHPGLAACRPALVAGINDLARTFRRDGLPVMWIRQEFEPDLSDAFLDMRRRGITMTIRGTGGCEILPELERAFDDRVLVKKRYSAFFGTAVDEILAGLRPRSLVLAGVNTHACIRSSAIDAYQRDYDVIVATDCVGSYDEEHHRVTLRYLEGKIARLMNNTEVSRLLGAAFD